MKIGYFAVFREPNFCKEKINIRSIQAEKASTDAQSFRNKRLALFNISKAEAQLVKELITAKNQEVYHQSPKEFCVAAFDDGIEIGGIQ